MSAGERLRRRTAAGLASAALAWRSRPGPVVRALAALPAGPAGGTRRQDSAPGSGTGRSGTGRSGTGGSGTGAFGTGRSRTGRSGTGSPALPSAHRVRVAAVQLRARLYVDGGAFAAHLGTWVARACATGASLVVLPEDVALGLLGMIPGFERLARRVLSGGAAGVTTAGTTPMAARPAELLAFAAPALERVHRQAAAALAARYGVTLVAGTAPALRQDRLLNVCPVFGPDGRLLGEQSKLHPFPHEVGWGIGAGDDLTVWPTPAGRLAAAVCMDATYFETFRIARRMGAEVVAVPAADPAAYNPWKALRGPWPRAQESQMFALHSCLVGELAGVTLSGRSAVYAPLELTAAGDGVLAAVADPAEEGLAVADLDLEALRRLRAARPLPAAPEVAARWFPGVYDGVGD